MPIILIYRMAYTTFMAWGHRAMPWLSGIFDLRILTPGELEEQKLLEDKSKDCALRAVGTMR